jgi:hypothetical protein
MPTRTYNILIMKAQAYKASLSTVRQAAWELATRLVEQSDFTGNEMVRARLTDLSILNQEHSDEWWSRVLPGLVSFGIDTKIPNQGRMWAPLFLEVAYKVPADGVKVIFNFSKHPELQALKETITLLRHQNKLSPDGLQEVMGEINPRVRYDVVLKKLPEVLSPA